MSGSAVPIPGSTVSMPGSAVLMPGNTVSVPGSAVSMPGSTVSMPGSTVTVPGSTVSMPGNTVPIPGDAVPMPGSAVPVPGSAVLISGSAGSIPDNANRRLATTARWIRIEPAVASQRRAGVRACSRRASRPMVGTKANLTVGQQRRGHESHFQGQPCCSLGSTAGRDAASGAGEDACSPEQSPRPPLQHDPQPLHLPIQRLARHAEGFRGIGDVTAAGAQE